MIDTKKARETIERSIETSMQEGFDLEARSSEVALDELCGEIERLAPFERDAMRLPEYVRGNEELRKREAQLNARILTLESQLARAHEAAEKVASDE